MAEFITRFLGDLLTKALPAVYYTLLKYYHTAIMTYS